VIVKIKEIRAFVGIIISSDFECGGGISFQRLNKNHFRIRIPADPPNPFGGRLLFVFLCKYYKCERISS